MKAKVIVAFGTYQVGNIFEPPGLLFDELKRRQWVEEYKEPVEKLTGKKHRSNKKPK
jgi:hypothetical protein